jgi:hypothetical protein
MNMSSNFQLPADEQDLFRQEYYGHSPVVIPRQSLLATPAEAFEGLMNACEAAKAGRAEIKLFLDDMMILDPQHPLLPQEKERSLDTYRARLSQDRRVSEFAIYSGAIQAHSPLIFDRVRGLLIELFGDNWMPPGWIDAELFLGRYQYTPGGVHKEARSNLHCVVDGSKSMLVWPEEACDETSLPVLGEHGLQPTAETVLSGVPGGILYWPPTHWHVGTSSGFRIGINIAVYEPEDSSSCCWAR